MVEGSLARPILTLICFYGAWFERKEKIGMAEGDVGEFGGNKKKKTKIEKKKKIYISFQTFRFRFRFRFPFSVSVSVFISFRCVPFRSEFYCMIT